jgi:signal transduction histidine kinase
MKPRTASRLGWSVFASSVALGGVGLFLIALNYGPDDLIENSVFFVVFMAMAIVGAVAVSRQHQNAVGWIFLAIGLAAAVAFATSEFSTYALETRPGSLPGGVWAALLADTVWILILALPFVFLPLLFPDGRLPSRRWRSLAWLAAGFIGFVSLVFLFDPGPVGPTSVPNPVGIEALRSVAQFLDGPGYLGLLLLGLVSVGSQVLRFRRAAGMERQQIKWFAFGVVLLALSFLVDAITGILGVRGGVLLDTVIPAVGFTAVPVGAGIAILKYRLYEIDVVISKTLVYLLLAGFITVVYVLVVVAIPVLVFGQEGGFNPLPFAAAAIVALAFQPVRRWATRLANRLIYGRRATPYEVLSEFSHRVAGTYASEDVLPRMARILGEGTGAARAEVWLRVGDQLRAAASWPEADTGPRQPIPLAEGQMPHIPGTARAIPVEHQGELLGALAISMPRGASFTPTTEKLVRDVATQAGLVLRNVRLIEELRASRQRLVAAQDQERRRLERNIHDGAQQQLVALAVNLRLAETLAERDPAKTKTMIAEVRGAAQEALDDLRDLARGIYPPLLADKGLAAALEAQARKATIPVRVEPNGIGRFSQEAEAAAYFCVLEALQNVAKYAEASQVNVRLRTEDGQLIFTVQDDGRGFNVQQTPSGTGLQNMKDRLDALGGTFEIRSAQGEGTTITGRVPVSS